MNYVCKGKACAEDHPKSKLTMDKVIRAREQYARKEKTVKQLADENGVYYCTMLAAIRGDTWRIDRKDVRERPSTFHWPKKHEKDGRGE